MTWWRYYPPKPAREVKGGIKAQSRRGPFAASWWGRRWIQVLESFNIGERLNRGRTYARQGQVMDIDIDACEVRARVQGSRSRPYTVVVRFRPLSPAQWRYVVKELSRRFLIVAKLLAGEMPPDIEDIFALAKLSLFPHRLQDLETTCSCPDWSNPCKHLAAVFYLLAEEFDRDPFLLFKLRGLSREEFFALLGYGPAAAAVLPAAHSDGLPEPAPAASLETPAFWGEAESLDDLLGEVSLPEVAAVVPKRLGSFPFWRGQVPLLEVLEPLYLQAAATGLNLFSGLEGPPPQEDSPPPPDRKTPKLVAPARGKEQKKKPRGGK